MTKGITLKRIWSDEDVVQLEIHIADGASAFTNKVYIGHPEIDDLIENLDRFKDQVHGGLYDLRLGEFGAEYGGGAIHARFHFHKPGRLYITIKAQSDFMEFTKTLVASEATLYLVTEPALLDQFIVDLKKLKSGVDQQVFLQAV
jgi:hypothetical protein